MGTTQLDTFLRALTSRHRVMLLGGLAVIAHGLSRATKDADVWLEPLTSPDAWAEALLAVQHDFAGTHIARLPGWTPVQSAAEIAAAIEEVGMVRVLGLECPLDVFRRPNEFVEEAFDEVWSRAIPKADGVFLPEVLDVLVSKYDTGRERDTEDTYFLETKLRAELGARLEVATPDEARAIFARYADHAVATRALANPDAAVQVQGREILVELAAQGDPFAREVLGLGPA